MRVSEAVNLKTDNVNLDVGFCVVPAKAIKRGLYLWGKAITVKGIWGQPAAT